VRKCVKVVWNYNEKKTVRKKESEESGNRREKERQNLKEGNWKDRG
jgi:hypothetical protein